MLIALEAMKENLFCLSPSFWWFAGSLWYCLACRHISLLSAFMFAWRSPSVPLSVRTNCPSKDTSPIGLGLTLMTF